MKNKNISFIDVSYDELYSVPINQLEYRIRKNLEPYFERISHMTLDEKIKLRENVKQTRKENFRFAQERIQNIPKDRIQLALSELARLFRALDNGIKNE